MDETSKLVEFIKAKHPDLVIDKPLKINTSGSANLIVMVGEDPDEQWVFRFPRKENVYAIQQMELESRILKLIKDILPIPIPNYVFKSDPCDEIQYVVYQYIPGKPLTIENFIMLDDNQKDQIAKELGITLQILHQFDFIPHYPAEQIEKSMIRAAWTEKFELVEQHAFPYLTLNERNWASQFFHQYLSDDKYWLFPSCLTHGDLKGDHILCNEAHGGLSGIIDFRLQIGDPAVDFGFLMMYGENFVDRVMQYYGVSPEDNLKDRARFYYLSLPFDGLLYGALLNRTDLIEEHLVRLHSILNNTG
ncbi:phosphotransferase [Paenibacillus vini]|uniref:6'-aminoglycoside N-acetyltransferase n=1 Tax=Paenibacillus vini TaxID=1476024 RepID=A0ABQ4MGE9_9BACL|nr:phosphotransferase [Paenibacillus vini]GIP55064.1 6'-aminoglycoside N-acetyltransferase [Paenibacillus vini]